MHHVEGPQSTLVVAPLNPNKPRLPLLLIECFPSYSHTLQDAVMRCARVSALGVTFGCAFISSYSAHARAACGQPHHSVWAHRRTCQPSSGGGASYRGLGCGGAGFQNGVVSARLRGHPGCLHLVQDL